MTETGYAGWSLISRLGLASTSLGRASGSGINPPIPLEILGHKFPLLTAGSDDTGPAFSQPHTIAVSNKRLALSATPFGH
jgi:hypothetical protein